MAVDCGSYVDTQEVAQLFSLPRIQKTRGVERRRSKREYEYAANMDNAPYALFNSGTSPIKIIKQGSSQALSVITQVKNIETFLGLNRSQTAAALGVTRKTVYDWINKGAQLSDATTKLRLQQLSNIASKQPDESMGKFYGSNLQRPVIGNKSLIDILYSDNIDVDSALVALLNVRPLANESKARIEAFAKKQPAPQSKLDSQATIDNFAPRT